jgi:hypothetical protein
MGQTLRSIGRIAWIALAAVLPLLRPDTCLAGEAASGRLWFTSVASSDWRAQSPKDYAKIYSADIPQFRSRHLVLEIGTRRDGNRWENAVVVSQQLPASVRFDDGTGHDRTLNPEGSSRVAGAIEGTLIWKASRDSHAFIGLGPLVRLEYERRTLEYLDARERRAWEAGVALGLSFATEWRIWRGFGARFELDNSFRPRGFSLGRMETPFAEPASARRERMQSAWTLAASHTWRDGKTIELRYARTEWFYVAAEDHSDPMVGRSARWVVRFGIRR